MKPRILDLFCGAGGAAMGYSRAGFDVVGVDIAPQPAYPFEFVQADALEVLRALVENDDRHEPIGVLRLESGSKVESGTPVVQRLALNTVDADHVAHTGESDKPALDVKDFDAIHASPPCQAFTDLKDMHNAKHHEDMLTPTRKLLQATGLPYVIENVEGAPMENHVTLCGGGLGLGLKDGSAELRRHRHFETNFPVGLIPPCAHGWAPRVIGVYGGHGRDRRRKQNTQDFTVEQRREAMGIDWMNGTELSQAIPPAYTELIGHQLLVHLRAEAAA